MAYIHERPDGTEKVHKHQLRAMLRGSIEKLLSKYPIDDVLSEIASQRPSWDIRISVAGSRPKRAAEDREEVGRSA